MLRGFTTTHTNPSGLQKLVEVHLLRPLARRFRMLAVNRPPGHAADTTMADVARLHARALDTGFGEPVDVLGTSSGGSVALELAADRPDVVRRLVLVAAGCRLSPEARAAQMRYVEAVEQGRRGAQHLAPLKVGPRWAPVVGAAMWLLDPLLRPADPRDMARFARAEDAFDLTGRLGDVTAPTLVIGGAADRVYSPAIFRETAEGVRDGRLVIYPGTGHGGTLAHRRLVGDVAAFLL